MQITIVQAEIELAIKQYILSQINVREGMEVDIEMKATRGETGYQAFITIYPKTEKPVAAPTPNVAVASFPARVQAQSHALAPRTPAEVRSMMEQEAEEVSEEPQGEDAAAEEVMPSPVAAAEMAAAAPQVKSLFKGLRKPSNG